MCVCVSVSVSVCVCVCVCARACVCVDTGVENRSQTRLKSNFHANYPLFVMIGVNLATIIMEMSALL